MFDFKNSSIERFAGRFNIEGNILSVERFGSGHINDTFCVRTDKVGGKSYLLQRINNHIFTDVEGLMANTEIVLTHLKQRLADLGEADIERKTLTLVPTHRGELYYGNTEEGYWRMFILLEGTRSYDIVETPAQAYSGGQAFGNFQKLLADLDASRLVEILPHFHDLDFRMRNLREAIDADVCGRVKEVEDVLGYIFEREEDMRTVLVMGSRGELPLRITHNDTKFNNVLLDQDDRVQCVIDLDTVMPGYVAYDFGDAIRTIINSAAEDEADLSKIGLNIPLFRAYTEGYISAAKDFLTDSEIDSLIHGVYLLPFMQAVRFLTDYINGDKYYKTNYPMHNLVRTHAQLKLVREMELHRQHLTSILKESICA